MKRQQMIGYLFILPSIIGVSIFFLFPLLFSLVLSFTNWSGPSGRGTEFIGMENFQRILGDEVFRQAFFNNFLYLIHVPIAVFLGFLVAVFLNRSVYMKNALRAVFFLPYLISPIAIGFVWMLLFHPSEGPINVMLMSLGVDNPPGWLSSTGSSMYAIIIMSAWQIMGFNIIIYLAALQGVPRELEEACSMDGAKKWQITRYVTFPFVSPITLFLLIIGVANAFKNFGLIQAVTGGGPGNSTTILPLYVYQTAFRYYELGYASTIAIILFLVIFAITLLQWLGQKKWVHY
ncbi:carbohydrate ABC transporter permease [Alteribacter natronophilus]|uniref:carbohydrate ABC transporter permease n=1 Tax=Alteribacter natronophilus TaxID=2583810 RepID=UPI00110D25B6|nr:sugar ABC transporter permease [Alteribacter natronophilus]TMW72533.1 sugar ABC transporter permease [Alteribacter natronophilus]